MYLRTGNFFLPFSSTSNFSFPSLSFFSGLGEHDAINVELKGETVGLKDLQGPSYKWLENGNWHYGDAPPENVNAIRIDGSNLDSEKQ